MVYGIQDVDQIQFGQGWEVKKNAIKSIIKLPKPKVKIDYNTDSNDYEF